MPNPYAVSGMEFGIITQRATPGAGVLLAGTVTPWVSGVRGAALSNGNSGDIPAADGSNPRIDLLLSDGSWQAGTAAADPAFPTPTSGKAWLCAVWHRTSNEVVRNFDNGTDSFIIGWNYLFRAYFQRPNSQTGVSVAAGTTEVAQGRLPIYLEKGAVLNSRQFGTILNSQHDRPTATMIYLDGAEQTNIGHGIRGAVVKDISAYYAAGTARMRRQVSAGAHQLKTYYVVVTAAATLDGPGLLASVRK